MGCWNKTCGLSNLHITAGQEAYVFVLENKPEGDHCYTTHLYRPLLLPFVTEYNDYGGGENSSGIGLNFVMSAIKESLHEMELGENEYHDIAVKQSNFNEEMFFNAVHEGRLFRKGNYSDPVKLEYVMFRKDIVDDILEKRIIEQYVGGGNGTCGYGNNYIQYKFADIAADVKPLIQALITKFSEERVCGRLLHFYGLDDLCHMFDKTYSNKVLRWLRFDTYRYSRLVDISMSIRTVCNDPTDGTVAMLEQLLIEYLKGVFIDNFMECTRKSWIPAGHEGSQSQDHDEYRVLINAMTKVLDAEQAEYAE